MIQSVKRKFGLQHKWEYVVNSLNEIVGSYEETSHLISLFLDKKMRLTALSFIKEGIVLDMGSGPGTVSKLLDKRCDLVLLDFSRKMLRQANFENRIVGVFESMPFRDCVFDSVVSSFAIRDSYDLLKALKEVRRVCKDDSVFWFCDIGRPDSFLFSISFALYLAIFPYLFGTIKTVKKGRAYASLLQTYFLLPNNSTMKRILGLFFQSVKRIDYFFGTAVIYICKKKV